MSLKGNGEAVNGNGDTSKGDGKALNGKEKTLKIDGDALKGVKWCCRCAKWRWEVVQGRW